MKKNQLKAKINPNSNTHLSLYSMFLYVYFSQNKK